MACSVAGSMMSDGAGAAFVRWGDRLRSRRDRSLLLRPLEESLPLEEVALWACKLKTSTTLTLFRCCCEAPRTQAANKQPRNTLDSKRTRIVLLPIIDFTASGLQETSRSVCVVEPVVSCLSVADEGPREEKNRLRTEFACVDHLTSIDWNPSTGIRTRTKGNLPPAFKSLTDREEASQPVWYRCSKVSVLSMLEAVLDRP